MAVRMGPSLIQSQNRDPANQPVAQAELMVARHQDGEAMARPAASTAERKAQARTVL